VKFQPEAWNGGVLPRADRAQAQAHAVAPIGVDGDQEAGQEESQQHPPTCATPSPPPHPLTGLWQPASTRPATLSPSHGPCSSGGAGRWLVTLASWKTAAVSGQLPRQGRPRHRHPLSLALSLSVLLVLLLSRCKQARQAGTSNCDLTDLPGRKGEGGESLVRWIRSQPFNP